MLLKGEIHKNTVDMQQRRGFVWGLSCLMGQTRATCVHFPVAAFEIERYFWNLVAERHLHLNPSAMKAIRWRAFHFWQTALPLFLFLAISGCQSPAEPPAQSASETEEVYQFDENSLPRWSSFENPTAAKGQGGQDNKGAKGHAFERWKAGEEKVLLDTDGSGVVQRIWLTVPTRDTASLHTLRINMYWDGAASAAVDAPLGDFFGNVWGKTTAFETHYFSNPEGRSFVSILPMPFRNGARITLRNTTGKDINHIFYDVNFTKKPVAETALYLHALQQETKGAALGTDHEILPRIEGKGKFLGVHVGIRTDPSYEETWWGEGEVKMYLDGDSDFPTLNGTGTEDYIGTGWGQGAYVNRYQGCWVADFSSRMFTFYRYHVPDPIYFQEDIRVTIQQIGGASKAQVIRMLDEGVNLQPISIDEPPANGVPQEFVKLLEKEPPVPLTDPSLPEGWTNFYRSDHWTSTAFFYLNRPEL